MDLNDVILIAIKFIVPSIFLAWVGYLFGLRSFAKKNQHEQIVHRYLEQGVDLLSANIDHALHTFNQNFAHALGLLKEFRDTERVGVPLRKESKDKMFLTYDTRAFSIIPFYKIKSLVGDDIFWTATQNLFAFVDTAHDFFERDLKLAIDTYCTDRQKVNVDSEKLVDSYLKKVRELMDESHAYYSILMELQNIALILETDTSLTFGKLENLKCDKKIQEVVTRLKNHFSYQSSNNHSENAPKGVNPEDAGVRS
jgi:putative NIF3 family GTP cyclohydrolase 1 type 2